MRTLIALAITLAASLCLNGAARAASLFFQAIPTAPTIDSCPPGGLGQCYQLRMFYEDATRSLELSSLQMDIDIQGAYVPPLPVHLSTNTNAAAGRVFVENADGDAVFIPFSSQTAVIVTEARL